MESQRDQCEKFKEERADKNATLRSLEMEYTTLTSQLEQQKENIERLTSEKEETVKRILEVEYEQTEAQTKLNGLESEAAEKELTEEEKPRYRRSWTRSTS